MFSPLIKLLKDEEAPTAVEYALMVACLAAVVIAGAFALGTNANSRFNSLAGSVANVSGSGNTTSNGGNGNGSGNGNSNGNSNH